MAQHPATPSPHRFLQSTRKPPARHPSSSLRNSLPAFSTRFVQTPRFTLPSSNAFTSSNQSAAFSTPFPRTAPRETIESPPSSPPTQHSPSLPIRSPARKRTRVSNQIHAIPISSSPSNSEDENGSASPTTLPHEAQVRDEEGGAVVSTPSAGHLRDDRNIKPPIFKLPPDRRQDFFATQGDIATQSQLHAGAPPILPTQRVSQDLSQSAFFSPTRKGERYVTGGLARSVRDWIIQASNGAASAFVTIEVGKVERVGGKGWLVREKHQPQMRDEDGDMEMLEEQVAAHEQATSKAEAQKEGDDDNSARWLLIQQDEKGKDGEAAKVITGDSIEVQGPTWEVEIQGQMCRVAVEWRIVNAGEEMKT